MITPMAVLERLIETRAHIESGCALGRMIVPEGDDVLPAPRRAGDSPLDYDSLVHLTRGVSRIALLIFEAQLTLTVAHEIIDAPPRAHAYVEGEDGYDGYQTVAIGPTDSMIARAAGISVDQVKAEKASALAIIAANLDRAFSFSPSNNIR
jgi:hypothetical protein